MWSAPPGEVEAQRADRADDGDEGKSRASSKKTKKRARKASKKKRRASAKKRKAKKTRKAKRSSKRSKAKRARAKARSRRKKAAARRARRARARKAAATSRPPRDKDSEARATTAVEIDGAGEHEGDGELDVSSQEVGIGSEATATSAITSEGMTDLPGAEIPPRGDRPEPDELEPESQPETRPDQRGDWVTDEFIALAKDGTKLYRREARATRRKGEIKIDGVLDEPAWREAPVTRFNWQERPHEGAEATGPTDFQVLYDDDAVYVGIHAIDPEPDKIAGILHHPLGLRKIPQSDWLVVYLDPTFDRRMVYAFAVNPVGVKMDLRVYAGGLVDDTYQAIWEAENSRDESGWYAEFRIPYSQMRVTDGFQNRWGFQIQRKFSRTQERSYWSPFTFRAGMEVTGFGNLVIEDEVHAGRPIELLPYLLGGVRAETSIPEEDTLNDPLSPRYGAGLDAKVQVSSSLRLTASINPDFGQVEADPSEVNLTDQETFFSERRPLFIEDADLYGFAIGSGVENLFYSRRIGAPPHFSQAATASYVREADVTSIYGAAKLSGELGAGFNLGLLSALAAEESSLGQLPTGDISEQVIEPITSYNVAQLSRPFRGGASELRLVGTGVYRFLDGTGIDTLHRRAFTGGAQYLHQFAGNRWALFGMVAGSRVEGDPAALAITQQASQRYFQRPDAEHVEFDPTRTRLDGYAFNGQIRKIAGVLQGEIGVDGRSPGFETNDIGFLTDADRINPWLRVSSFDPSVGGDVVQSRTLGARIDTFANFAPELLAHRASVNWDVLFTNLWSIGGTAQFTRTLLDTRLLRGGPAVRGQDEYGGSLHIGTDPSRDFQLTLDGSASYRPASSSWRGSAGIGLTWNLRSSIELTLNPTIIRNVDDSQYVGAAMDAAGDTHYVLGRLKQTTLVATTRLEYTMTPRMSLQFYGQPFISAGRYARYQETADVRAASYEDRFTEFNRSRVSEAMGLVEIDADGDGTPDFSVPRPDFQFGTLLTNLVYRWEYLPGSHLYLIWSQARQSFEGDGVIRSDDIGDVFNSQSVHVFLVKLSYWWNL